ncbi:hypothetical protein BHE74_00029507 [Ensete ventricosum]|nr:hypothetical protein BHE74_00029507 [Ensete ventricosum]RZR80118.1 hypothetical protein BHM03_00006045 [Ensete ventricosum]
MAEREIAVTEEALHQYIIIRKLHMELEEEREASATAASEALSMILKLQREKAVEKMEARHYKRMAEEKLHYAEQCLIILEEEMQQKEIENSILKHQLQLYKSRLLSIGISNFELGDVVTCSDMSSGDSAFLEETNLHGRVRRNFSLPSLRLGRLYSEIDRIDNNPLLPSWHSTWKFFGDCSDHLSDKNKKFSHLFQESATDDHNSEDVNRRGKYDSSPGRMGQQTTSDSSEDSSSCSWYSAVTGAASCHSKPGTKIHLDAECVVSLPFQAEEQVNTAECANLSISYNQTEPGKHLACVHDIFEVPESDKYHGSSEPMGHFVEESIKETMDYGACEDFMPQETVGFLYRDNDWLDREFTCSHDGSQISSPTCESNKMLTPRKGEMMNYNSVLVDSVNRTCIMRNDFEHIKCQLQQIENEKIMKMEDSERNSEELKLLREIYEKLNSIESHLKSSKSKKCPQHDESQLVSVIEVSLRCYLYSNLCL